MRLMISHAALATSIGLALGLGSSSPVIGQPVKVSSHDQATGNWLRWYGSREQLQARFPGIDAGIDYGSFQWLPSSALGDQSADPSATTAGSSFELDLGGLRFDPLRDGAPSAALARNWHAAPGADWRLVQFHGPVQQSWLDKLAAAGVEAVQYIHPYSYVVWADAQAMTRSAALPELRWQGEFLPEYRVAPVFRRQSDAEIDVNLIVRGDVEGLDQALSALGAPVLERGRMDRHLDMLQVRVAGNRLPELASVPGVYTVQPVIEPGNRSEMSVQINVGNVDDTGLAFPGYIDYLADIGVTGDGVIMACVDSGTQANHPDLVNRMLPCTGPTCGTGTQSGDHGTHVAGIMVADGSSGVVNPNGFLRGLGMAPGARLFEQRYTLPAGTPAYLNRMRDSVRNNAVLSNNSWGGGGPAGYESTARQVDVGTRDADVDAEGDQPLLYVLAIDNGGGGTSSQGVPDEAKNIFTIGSAWAQVNGNQQDMRNTSISSNSGHGPALDGRFIPHMIANSRFTESTAGANGYVMQGGTSQAAPHVAGASGLFFEYYRGLFDTDPSPALVKAAFLPVTQDLVGNNDANNNPIGARPDRKQGWGRMRPNAVLAPEFSVIYIDQSHVFAETGETWSAQYQADDPEQPMKLMLVWTDAPGHGLGGSTPAWNNDLDLRVGVGEDIYLGNVFTDGWSATGGSADARNNTEGVFLQPEQHGGTISVEVLAANITSNALPNAGADNAQDFALVCYNCVEAGAPSSDLALTMTDVPDPVIAGETLTYVFGVVNFGPDTADNIQLSLILPDAANYALDRSLGGGAAWECLGKGNEVRCAWPERLEAASQAPMLEVEVRIAVNTPPGMIEAQASVSSDNVDPRPGNDSAQATTQVLLAPERIFDDGFECVPDAPGCASD